MINQRQTFIKKIYDDFNIKYLLNNSDTESVDGCIQELCSDIFDLKWALTNIMDGMKKHEIHELTGLTEEDCQKIWKIYTSSLSN